MSGTEGPGSVHAPTGVRGARECSVGLAHQPYRLVAQTQGDIVGRIVVDVMPKPEILDPQGKAINGALPRLGFTEFSQVRQGKRFELSVEGEVTEQILDQARKAAEEMLSNPVIEDVVNVAVIDESETNDEAHA